PKGVSGRAASNGEEPSPLRSAFVGASGRRRQGAGGNRPIGRGHGAGGHDGQYARRCLRPERWCAWSTKSGVNDTVRGNTEGSATGTMGRDMTGSGSGGAGSGGGGGG